MNSGPPRGWTKILAFLAASAAISGSRGMVDAPRDASPPMKLSFTYPVSFARQMPPDMDKNLLQPKFPFPDLKNTDKYLDHNKAAIAVMDPATGQMLFSHDAHATRFPASLTKLMTLFLTFWKIETGRLKMTDTLDARVKKSLWGKWKKRKVITLGVDSKDKPTTREMALGTAVNSAADAAEILAGRIGGNTENFVAMMNDCAKDLGMTGTHFTNPSGAPDRRQKTTAADMAILMRAMLVYFPEQYQICQTKSFSYFRANGGKPVKNHALLPGAVLAKTGFIDDSKYNIAVAYPDCIIVVFGGETAAYRNKQVQELRQAVPAGTGGLPGKKDITDLPDKHSPEFLMFQQTGSCLTVWTGLYPFKADQAQISVLHRK